MSRTLLLAALPALLAASSRRPGEGPEEEDEDEFHLGPIAPYPPSLSERTAVPPRKPRSGPSDYDIWMSSEERSRRRREQEAGVRALEVFVRIVVFEGTLRREIAESTRRRVLAQDEGRVRARARRAKKRSAAKKRRGWG